MTVNLTYLRKIAAVIGVIALAGCTYQSGYQSDYVTAPPATDQLAGSGAVAMPSATESTITEQSPSSFTGGVTTLKIPVNKIVKEIAVTVFGAKLKYGVISVSDTSSSSGKTYLIEPTVKKFDYKYDSASNLGFAVTPRVSVTVHISVKDAAGTKVMEREYQKDHAQGTYVASMQPAERVSKALHQAVKDIMVEAAGDFARIVRTPPNQVPSS